MVRVWEVGVGYEETGECVMRAPGFGCERSIQQLGPVRVGVMMTVGFSYPAVVAAAAVDGQFCVMIEYGPTPILQTQISFECAQLTPYAIEACQVLGVDVPGLSEIPLKVL